MMKFPVEFEVETAVVRTKTLRIEDMTPEHSVVEVWALIHFRCCTIELLSIIEESYNQDSQFSGAGRMRL
jgi:hypothetical protein